MCVGGMGECDNPSYIDSTSVSEYLLNARCCVKCSRCEGKKKRFLPLWSFIIVGRHHGDKNKYRNKQNITIYKIYKQQGPIA